MASGSLAEEIRLLEAHSHHFGTCPRLSQSTSELCAFHCITQSKQLEEDFGQLLRYSCLGNQRPLRKCIKPLSNPKILSNLNKYLLSPHSVPDTVISNRKTKVDETPCLLSAILSGQGCGHTNTVHRHTNAVPQEQHKAPEKHSGNANVCRLLPFCKIHKPN